MNETESERARVLDLIHYEMRRNLRLVGTEFDEAQHAVYAAQVLAGLADLVAVGDTVEAIKKRHNRRIGNLG